MANKLFTAFGEIVLRKRGVDEGIDATKQKAEELGDAFERTGARSDASLKEMGDNIKKNTEGMRSFQTALTSTIGIVTGMLGVFTLIAGAVASIITLAQRWRDIAREQNEAEQERLKTYEEIKRTLELELAIAEKRITPIDAEIERLKIATESAKERVAVELGLNELMEQREEQASLLRDTELLAAGRGGFAARMRQQQEALAQTDRQIERARELIDLQGELGEATKRAIREAEGERRMHAGIDEAEAKADEEERRNQERITRQIAHGLWLAESQDRHRDSLDKLLEYHLLQLELDQKAHQERLRQIEREGAAATRASERGALRLGVASGNAEKLLQEINSKTQRPTMRYRTTRGGG